MALSFIGKPISLISHSDVRYRGILAGIDPQASTIQLSNVYSMGTESRRPPEQFIPPNTEPYQYIIFKAAEVKDLAVDEPVVQPRRNVLDDPAVMASAPLASNNYAPYAPPAPAGIPQTQPPPYAPSAQVHVHPPHPQQPQVQTLRQTAAVQQQQPQQQGTPAPPPTAAQVVAGTAGQAVADDTAAATAPRAPQQTQQQQQPRRPNAVQTAAASLETVGRALGDLRISGGSSVTTTAAVVSSTTHHPQGGRGGRRGGGGGPRGGRAGGDTEIKVPSTDFDFESMNAKFDKAALAAAAAPKTTAVADPNSGPLSAAAAGTTNGATATEGVNGAEKEKAPAAYNPSKSFFDTLSSNTAPEPGSRGGHGGAGGRGRGGRGGGGRNRREEEREKNVATFGEPGGVGLMGPGAYVGGWGGYGRRGGNGGGRGRGRGGRGGPPRDPQVIPARG